MNRKKTLPHIYRGNNFMINKCFPLFKIKVRIYQMKSYKCYLKNAKLQHHSLLQQNSIKFSRNKFTQVLLARLYVFCFLFSAIKTSALNTCLLQVQLFLLCDCCKKKTGTAWIFSFLDSFASLLVHDAKREYKQITIDN